MLHGAHVWSIRFTLPYECQNTVKGRTVLINILDIDSALKLVFVGTSAKANRRHHRSIPPQPQLTDLLFHSIAGSNKHLESWLEQFNRQSLI